MKNAKVSLANYLPKRNLAVFFKKIKLINNKKEK